MTIYAPSILLRKYIDRQQIYLSFKRMKDSYIRSKVELRPLNSSDFHTKKPIVDYQQYQQQLSYYQKNKKGPDITQLFDWTKPSEILSLKKPSKQLHQQRQPQIIANNSMNTEELLGQDRDQADKHQSNSDLQDSIDVQLPSGSPKPSYVEQVKADYGSQYKIMSQIKIEYELKEMREKIIEMNAKLNKMLDRYELLAGTTPQKEVQIQNPYKFLSKQIELNNRILQKQAYQINQIELKQKELQKKDYLVELDQLIIQIKKEIHDIEKQKHTQQVGVEKIDKLLKQFESIQEEGDQYKEVKELKHLIVFYFKKLNDQKLVEEHLDQEMQNLAQRQNAISNKLVQLSQVAVINSLDVSTNKNYLQLKRKYDELIVQIQSLGKKKEVQVKCSKANEERLQKQISSMKKQLQKCEMDIQQTQYRSISKDEETSGIISKNNILTRQIKSISYKFDESLIHPDKSYSFKPNFKRVSSRLEQSATATNKTIDNHREQDNRKFFNINDKNAVPEFIPQSLQNSNSNSNSETSNSRLKPILRSWKGKPAQKQRYMASPEKYNTIQSSNIFKPPHLLKARK